MLPFVPLRLDSGEDPAKLNSSFHPDETGVNFTRTLAAMLVLTYGNVVTAIDEAGPPLAEIVELEQKLAAQPNGDEPPRFDRSISSTYTNPCFLEGDLQCVTTLDKVNDKYAEAKKDGKIYNPVDDWNIPGHEEMARVSREVLFDDAWDLTFTDGGSKKRSALKSKAYIMSAVGRYDPKEVPFLPGHLFLAIEEPLYSASQDRPNPSKRPLRKVGFFGFFPDWSKSPMQLVKQQVDDFLGGSLGKIAMEFHVGDPTAITVAHDVAYQKFLGSAVPEGINAAEMHVVKSFDVDRDSIGMLRAAVASSKKKINQSTNQPYENIYMIDKIDRFESVRYNIYSSFFQPMLALQSAWWYYRKPNLVGNCATVIQELFKEDIASNVVCPFGVPKWCVAPESSKSSLFAAMLELVGLAKVATAKFERARTLQGSWESSVLGQQANRLYGGPGFGEKL